MDIGTFLNLNMYMHTHKQIHNICLQRECGMPADARLSNHQWSDHLNFDLVANA